MTTIAYSNGTLAADTQSTAGDTRAGFNIKVAKRGAVLAAAAGTTSLCQRFMDWFRSGMKGDPPVMKMDVHDAWGVLFYEDDRVAALHEAGWERIRTPIWTAGSGGDIALGAMSAGATPAEAVAIAARHDKNTGGDITVLTRADPDDQAAPVLQFKPRPRANHWGQLTNESMARLYANV